MRTWDATESLRCLVSFHSHHHTRSLCLRTCMSAVCCQPTFVLAVECYIWCYIFSSQYDPFKHTSTVGPAGTLTRMMIARMMRPSRCRICPRSIYSGLCPVSLVIGVVIVTGVPAPSSWTDSLPLFHLYIDDWTDTAIPVPASVYRRAKYLR